MLSLSVSLEQFYKFVSNAGDSFSSPVCLANMLTI